jgi:mannose-6-phosphate isomerase-like protein (cupin superfamily)
LSIAQAVILETARHIALNTRQSTKARKHTKEHRMSALVMPDEDDDEGGVPLDPALMDAATQEAVWFLGSLVKTRVPGASTGGAPAVLEHHNERGYAPPVHMHRYADETFIVMEGELRAEVGGQKLLAGEDAAVFLPRMVAHSFLVTSGDARYLTLHTPAGFDAFLRAAGTPDDGSGRVPAPPTPEQLRKIAAEHDIEIIGPPPIRAVAMPWSAAVSAGVPDS